MRRIMNGIDFRTGKRFVYWNLLLGLSVQILSGQVMLHADRPFYISGETALYTLYLPTELMDEEFVVGMTLYDPQGKRVSKSYLKHHSGKSLPGYFEIPSDIPHGVYRAQATMTTQDTSQELILIEVPISIYSDRLLDDPSIEWAQGVPGTGQPPSSKLNITMDLENTPIEAGQTLSLNIDVRDSQGNPVQGKLSISVWDRQLFGENVGAAGTIFSASTEKISGGISDAIVVTGKLARNEEGQLLTFHMLKSQKIHYTTTDEEGNFELELTDFYGNQTLQLLSHFSPGQQIKLTDRTIEPNTAPLHFTPRVKDYLQYRRQRRMIYRLYHEVEPAVTLKEEERREPPKADWQVETLDYPFRDLVSFCREVSTPLKYLKNSHGEWSFQMFNSGERDMLLGVPLFIIDGQFTKDQDFLRALDFQKLQELQLFYENSTISERFGFVGFSGVVILTSRTGNIHVPDAFAVQEHPIWGLQRGIDMFIPQKDQISSSQPLLLPQLYWDPQVELPEGKAEIHFRQSDDRSEFQIEVLFQSEDGRYGLEKLIYQVH